MSTQILMPALSPTMEEGKLAKWHVKEGDEVHSGDVIAEIETDKATMEFEAVDEGRIGKILVAEGTEGVKVNAPIAVLLEEGEDASAIAAAPAPDIHSAMSSIKDAVTAETKEVKQAKAEPAPKPAPAPAAAPAPQAADGERVFASPLAKRIAAQKGIDLHAVNGSGPRGRIVKADVESAQPGAAPVRKPAAAPAATPSVPSAAPAAPSALPDARIFFKPGEYEEIPHDSMRKSIAKRLTASTSGIPHFYLTIDCRIDALLAARKRLNDTSPKGEGAFKLSVNDFLVKAAALALKKVPECNASWTENAVLRHKHADVGVAVALDFGLITPIVFAAEDKGLAAISNEVKSLATRARDKKLKPQEYEGGTFAISNLGMFGISQFTAVINPPHAGILAVGAGVEKPVIVNGKVEVATVMTVTMSCDHRVIDGATGARFLQVFKQFVEDPAAMLL
ncbi:pyruvate dehydrogenase complex dihydrolipoamide acetyltransferase [Rhizomicrobium electricum]|uniref:Acetyltransferase component of pyruvate dehydrogenase complex n=1 Tax=Rhizomicrobium electricum TaxID=480070 RepID=A0ABP3PQX3_9PROT|nr:pyruvate dehydrogenase complex dihydrolipoamide acetyltransferase [Rhizomicrobium electricum]NIJ48840.1 pyruvate dehydrogenase E2 component (dihydrolipoamide acetyltransferase) [Rhizomicrobium electricum]